MARVSGKKAGKMAGSVRTGLGKLWDCRWQ
jgi:hypothetical protein